MFVPAQYREPDRAWMIELMRTNPLGLLLTNGDAEHGPFATHLPVIFPPSPPPTSDPDLSGTILLAHLNRANPHWRALDNQTRSVLVFTGPHAYVSPTVYQTDPAAPTWNYTAVHVHGTVTKIDSTEETLEVVRSTVRRFESDFGAAWDMSSSIGYFRKILPAVGAFAFTVSRAEGMFKLSQEQAPEVSARVRESFAGRECTRHHAVADLMTRLP